MISKKKKLKICFVLPPNLPVPAVKGGAVETLMNNLIDENERFGYFDFTVMCIEDQTAYMQSLKYTHTKFVYFKRENQNFIKKIKSYIYRGFRKIFHLHLTFLRNYESQVIRYISNDKFDYIINECADFHSFKKLNSEYGNEKLIAHLHFNAKPDEYIDRIYGYIFTVSQFIKEEWLKGSNISNERVYVLKNCIDTKKFNRKVSQTEKLESRKKFEFNDKDFIVLFCGRIIPEKGVKELILAVSNIQDVSVKLLIVGSPNFTNTIKNKYLSEVEKLVKQNSARIKFTGYIPNEELYKYYGICNIVVMPSIWEEPAGLVELEAMASERAIIVTNSGGINEFVTSKCSIEVIKEHNLEKELIQNIMYLKNNPDKILEMEKEAGIVSENYNVEKYYKDFSKIIYELENNIN